jgi:hypothetical protein
MAVKAKADERDNRGQQCTQSQHHEYAVAQKCTPCANGDANNDKRHVSSPTQQSPTIKPAGNNGFFCSQFPHTAVLLE